MRCIVIVFDDRDSFNIRKGEKTLTRWFFDPTATLHSLPSLTRFGAGADMDTLHWSKLHQRRDNRVVDCDRYSIFTELVAAARQPIAGKIQLALPTFAVIALQIARRVKAWPSTFPFIAFHRILENSWVIDDEKKKSLHKFEWVE